MASKSRICRRVAPEDVVRGAHVVVLSELQEFLVPQCIDAGVDGHVEPVRVRCMSSDLEPLEVVDLCLPLIVVRDARGGVTCLDVRRHALARLPAKVGRRLVRRIREAAKGR